MAWLQNSTLYKPDLWTKHSATSLVMYQIYRNQDELDIVYSLSPIVTPVG